jgi:hypothetical protein
MPTLISLQQKLIVQATKETPIYQLRANVIKVARNLC